MKFGVPIQGWNIKDKKVECTFHLIYMDSIGGILWFNDPKQVRFMLLHVLTTAVAKIQRPRVFNVRPFYHIGVVFF